MSKFLIWLYIVAAHSVAILIFWAITHYGKFHSPHLLFALLSPIFYLLIIAALLSLISESFKLWFSEENNPKQSN